MGGGFLPDLFIQIPNNECDFQEQDMQFPWAPETPAWCLGLSDLFFFFKG